MRIDELYGNAQSVSWLHGAFQTARLSRVLSPKEASHVLLADSEPRRQGVWRGGVCWFPGSGGFAGRPAVRVGGVKLLGSSASVRFPVDSGGYIL